MQLPELVYEHNHWIPKGPIPEGITWEEIESRLPEPTIEPGQTGSYLLSKQHQPHEFKMLSLKIRSKELEPEHREVHLKNYCNPNSVQCFIEYAPGHKMMVFMNHISKRGVYPHYFTPEGEAEREAWFQQYLREHPKEKEAFEKSMAAIAAKKGQNNGKES